MVVGDFPHKSQQMWLRLVVMPTASLCSHSWINNKETDTAGVFHWTVHQIMNVCATRNKINDELLGGLVTIMVSWG